MNMSLKVVVGQFPLYLSHISNRGCFDVAPTDLELERGGEIKDYNSGNKIGPPICGAAKNLAFFNAKKILGENVRNLILIF